MCEIVSGTVQTLDIPSFLLKNKDGFSLDFGSSVLKVVYAREVGENVRIHCVSYPRERMEEAFQFIKDNVGDKIQQGQEVYMTGVGSNQYKDKLESLLGIKVIAKMEFDCFVQGFLFLVKNFALEDLIHPIDPELLDSAKKMRKDWISSFQPSVSPDGLQPFKNWAIDAAANSEKVTQVEYPALLVICGSAATLLKVLSEDGRFEMTTAVNSVAGRTLLAVGSLFVNAKSFEEFMSLAANGCSENIDVYIKQIIKPGPGDSYSSFGGNELKAFSMGHAAGKDLADFTEADRAAGVVRIVTDMLAMWAHQHAHRSNVKHVYFVGGIHANSAMIRDVLGKEFAFRSLKDPLGSEWIQHHFVKLGIYLGALGALLQHLEPQGHQ